MFIQGHGLHRLNWLHFRLKNKQSTTTTTITTANGRISTLLDPTLRNMLFCRKNLHKNWTKDSSNVQWEEIIDRLKDNGKFTTQIISLSSFILIIIMVIITSVPLKGLSSYIGHCLVQGHYYRIARQAP